MEERVAQRMENEYVFPDGGRGWFDLSIHPVAEGIFILSVDITERKRAESILAEQVDELRRWHTATMGRETRILELKQEINRLLAQTGGPPRYPSAESEEVRDENP